jgi:ATP-binding cassette subfamily F protein 3
MGLPEPSRAGDVVLRAERLSKAFQRPLFLDLSFDVLRGQKWGILGPNGSGKTTLLSCLVGQQPLDAGRVVLGAGVKVGYFDQLLAQLEPDALVIDAIRPRHKEFTEQQRRNLLARYGLTGDMVFQKINSLSGGQLSRAALAMLAASDANLLLLDEPTNHLDLWARESLERTLQQFAGSLLFVSHDRYFLNQVADHLLVVERDRFRVVEGNYDTYKHLVQQGLAGGEAPVAGDVALDTAPAKRRTGRDKTAARRRQFPYRKIDDLEAEIHQREARVAQLHQALASSDVLRDGKRVKQAKSELDEHRQALAQLYQHWEEAAELN